MKKFAMQHQHIQQTSTQQHQSALVSYANFSEYLPNSVS